MEFFIEELIDLVLEGSIAISKNKRVSKWIRYPLTLLISLIFLIVFGIIFIVGILLLKESILAGILMFIIDIVFVIMSIVKFKKIYLDKKDNRKI